MHPLICTTLSGITVATIIFFAGGMHKRNDRQEPKRKTKKYGKGNNKIS